MSKAGATNEKIAAAINNVCNVKSDSTNMAKATDQFIKSTPVNLLE